jgi:hypothetical protein
MPTLAWTGIPSRQHCVRAVDLGEACGSAQ